MIRYCIYLLIMVVIVGICYIYELGTLSLLWYRSRTCHSFYEWICMVQERLNIRYHHSGYGGSIVVPHIILVNHVNCLLGVGSLTSLGGIVFSSCKVVCYKNYTSHVYLIGSLLERILTSEIQVDHNVSHEIKFRQMVDGVKKALNEGFNVVMFVDTGDYKKAIRTINRKVLEECPSVIKHLFHIKESSLYNEVYIHSYPPTKDLQKIIEYRSDILS
jgi:hypothetical protein